MLQRKLDSTSHSKLNAPKIACVYFSSFSDTGRRHLEEKHNREVRDLFEELDIVGVISCKPAVDNDGLGTS